MFQLSCLSLVFDDFLLLILSRCSRFFFISGNRSRLFLFYVGTYAKDSSSYIYIYIHPLDYCLLMLYRHIHIQAET